MNLCVFNVLRVSLRVVLGVMCYTGMKPLLMWFMLSNNEANNSKSSKHIEAPLDYKIKIIGGWFKCPRGSSEFPEPKTIETGTAPLNDFRVSTFLEVISCTGLILSRFYFLHTYNLNKKCGFSFLLFVRDICILCCASKNFSHREHSPNINVLWKTIWLLKLGTENLKGKAQKTHVWYT